MMGTTIQRVDSSCIKRRRPLPFVSDFFHDAFDVCYLQAFSRIKIKQSLSSEANLVFGGFFMSTKGLSLAYADRNCLLHI